MKSYLGFSEDLLPDDYFELDSDAIDACRPEIDVELLTVNPYSRPGTETKKIRGLVIHYTANPGASAMGTQAFSSSTKYFGQFFPVTS